MSGKSKLAAAGERIAQAAREFIDAKMSALQKHLDDRFATMRQYVDDKLKALPKPVDGAPGKDAEPVDYDALVDAAWERRHARVTEAIGKFVETSVAEAIAGITLLKGDNGKDGKDAVLPDFDAILRPLVHAAVRAAVNTLPKPKDGEPGKDGKDATLPEVQEIVDMAVAAAIAKLTPAKDGAPGKDAVLPDVPALVQTAVQAAVDALPKAKDGEPGAPGKDAVLPDVPALVQAAVDAAVQALPKPADGAPGKDAVLPDVPALVQAAVDALPKVKDGEPGAPGKDAVLPDVPALVQAAVDALPKAKDGTSVPIEGVRHMVEEQVAAVVAALPKPKDGEHGRDAVELVILGRIDETRSYHRGTFAAHRGGVFIARRETDPLQTTTLEASGWEVVIEGTAALVMSLEEDMRTVKLTTVMSSGREVVQTVKVPTMLDKGVYKEGIQYEQGDSVSYSGSSWIAQKNTTARPGENSDWRLAVKRGRDGAKEPEKGSRGPVRTK